MLRFLPPAPAHRAAPTANAPARLLPPRKNQTLLELYALFKQATVGDVNTERPGMFDFKGRAKWDAWEKKKGLDQAAAKEQYVALVAKLS